MATLGPAGARRGTTAVARALLILTLMCTTIVVVGVMGTPSANAAVDPIQLGDATNFAVLAATTVTSANVSTVNGDIGVSPGTAVTGFPPGQITNGTIHANDAQAVAAQAALAAAYADAVSRTNTATVSDGLGGTTKTAGVYNSPSGTFGIAGTLTLDAQGDPNAVFIFKALSTLITAASSTVNLINGAQSCNVFWQVGSSATLGANSILRGDVLAYTSITVGAGIQVDGRTLAMGAAVTLDGDNITRSTCETPGTLSITVPAAKALGTAKPGATASGSLGPVTVRDERLLSQSTWIASVIATDFTTGSASAAETIAKANVSYWSGPATSTTGLGDFTSGQPTATNAQIINVSRTAFSLVDGIGRNSATWNPTVSIHVPATAVVGAYTGKVTISVL